VLAFLAMGETLDRDDEPPSKSELKRQSRDLQDLGESLVALPAAELDALPLPDDVREAVVAARRITSHGARVRQRLYIGKLLRRTDVEPIRVALEQRAEVDRQRARREHAIELWRDRLVADEPGAWTELGTLVPAAEIAPLRALVRQARAESASARPPASSRRLFRRLRELLSESVAR
jgi:ribosome-associated protein